MTKEKVVRIKAAVPKPAQRVSYKNLAQSRLRLKKNYLDSKQRGEKSAVGDFLSNMGHNVASARMKGRVNENEEAQSKSSSNRTEDHDVLNWVAIQISVQIIVLKGTK